MLLKGLEAVAIHGSKSEPLPSVSSGPLLSLITLLFPIPPSAQEEREYAIRSFKSGAKDVMVASGVASKGLDFNEIQHVIVRFCPLFFPFSSFSSLTLPSDEQNYTMPKEIEDYVHQIGRTGRSGKTGIATTFVNMNTAEQTLLDLKYLLIEAKQRFVPRPTGHTPSSFRLARAEARRPAGARLSWLPSRTPTPARSARAAPSVVVRLPSLPHGVLRSRS